MSAAAAEVEAVQPAVVADATPAEATTQEPTIKQEERPDKPEEQIKQEESATDPEAPVKQEGVVKTEETAVAEKMEGVEKGTGEGDGQANSEETNSKIAPMLKTRAELHKDKSNKKYNPSVLAITNDPKTIRDQVCIALGKDCEEAC
jgi:lupus La protein